MYILDTYCAGLSLLLRTKGLGENQFDNELPSSKQSDCVCKNALSYICSMYKCTKSFGNAAKLPQHMNTMTTPSFVVLFKVNISSYSPVI